MKKNYLANFFSCIFIYTHIYIYIHAHVHILDIVFVFYFLEEEKLLEQAEEERIQTLLDISEDEYEAMDPDQQREIDIIRQQRYLERKRLYAISYTVHMCIRTVCAVLC